MNIYSFVIRMKSPRKKPTQKDVAREAGVSQAAVSRVAAGLGSSVSAETREKIEQVARRLGYRLSSNASKPSRPQIVYIYNPIVRHPQLPEPIYQSLVSFFGRLENAFAIRLAEEGYSMTLHPWIEGTDITHWLSESDVAGVIWRGRSASMAEWISQRFPSIQVNRLDCKEMDAVVEDQNQVIRLCCEHLWELGHRRILYIPSTPYNDALWQIRHDTFRQFHRDHQNHQWLAEAERFTDWIINERPNYTGYSIILDYWEQHGRQATAMIGGDIHIIQVAEEAKKKGLRIPDDLSLVGNDNLPESRIYNPPLNSVEAPWEAMAEVGVSMLLRRIANPSLPVTISNIASQLVIRNSTGPANIPHPQPKSHL